MSKKEKPKRMTDHWEKSMRDQPNTQKNLVMGSAFNPQPPSKRVKMYEKINECDY